MTTRKLLISLSLAISILGLPACSGGNSSSGFVPASPASTTRAPQDDIIPHQ